MKEFEFDPASTVLDICRMYVELSSSERFCAAVSDDGRSYSPQLFTLAEAVLGKSGEWKKHEEVINRYLFFHYSPQ